ncbi:MAG: class I SAM-dependent methyltransferase [Methanosarcinales archaeon Met12]|nr:MAG: class I SAM-dependent methyltransferase [Methanosarcinales archaeon Met12]
MNIEETKKIADKAEGWLTDEEGKTLYNLAKSCKGKGVIVEIGSWKGKSTICLGNGSKEGDKIKIFAIDPHTGSSEQQKMFGKVDTFEEFKKNIKNAKVGDIILPLVKTSEEAANNFDKPVEFGFIDGAHEYNFVKLDFDLWFPKVLNGGIIAFHDTTYWGGPKKVVADCVYKSKHFKNVKFVDSITFAQKVKQNTLKDRIKNRYVLLLKNLFEFAGKLHLPKLLTIIGKKLLKDCIKICGHRGNFT